MDAISLMPKPQFLLKALLCGKKRYNIQCHSAKGNSVCEARTENVGLQSQECKTHRTLISQHDSQLLSQVSRVWLFLQVLFLPKKSFSLVSYPCLLLTSVINVWSNTWDKGYISATIVFEWALQLGCRNRLDVRSCKAQQLMCQEALSTNSKQQNATLEANCHKEKKRGGAEKESTLLQYKRIATAV